MFKHTTIYRLFVLLVTMLLSASARAEDMAWSLTLSAEQNVGVFQDDLFAAMHLQLHQRLRMPQLGRGLDEQVPEDTSLRLTLQAPLRYRVQDREPLGDPTGLRQEDWDEPRDGLRVLRELGYGEPGSPLHVQLGELNAISLLDGALISGFFNAPNPDTPAAGALVTSSTRTQDTALMVDDVLQPGVIAASTLIRPFTIMKRDPLMQRFAVGAQVATDLRAPLSLERDGQGFVEVDATSSPTVTSGQRTFIGGPNLEFWVLAKERASLLVHAEIFWHDRLGRGEHIGLAGAWTPHQLLGIQFKSSAIFAHGRYVPRYISPLYQIERYQIQGLGAELPSTKLVMVNDLDPRQDLYLANTLTLDLPMWRSAVMLDYLWARDTPEADAITMSVRAQPIDMVSLRAYYHQNFFDGIGRSLSLERSLIGSELRVMPWGPLYVVGRYDRRWRLRDDGRWRGVQDWHIGLGAQFGFGVY